MMTVYSITDYHRTIQSRIVHPFHYSKKISKIYAEIVTKKLSDVTTLSEKGFHIVDSQHLQ